MNFKYLSLVLVVFVAMMGLSFATTNITSCGTLSSDNTIYEIQNNLLSNGTCLTISASNVTVDGNDYLISGNKSGSGILISGFKNSISNIKLTNFSNGINLSNTANNTTITNILIFNLVGLNGSAGAVGANCGPYVGGDTKYYPCVAGDGEDGIIGQNTIGIYINSSHNLIENVNITNLTSGSGGNGGNGGNAGFPTYGYCPTNCGGQRMGWGGDGGDGGNGGQSSALLISPTSLSNSIKRSSFSNISHGINGTNGVLGLGGSCSYGYCMAGGANGINGANGVNGTSTSVNLSSSSNNLFISISNEINYYGNLIKFYSSANQNLLSGSNIGWFPFLTSLGSTATIQQNTSYYNITGGLNADLTFNSSLNYWFNNSKLELQPSIVNITNGTYFTVSNDLYGWIANSLDGLSNVSYTWWNGSTAYSSGTAINLTGNSTGISHNIANISASLLNAGDVWILQINGTNGTTNVSDTNSSSITITNTAPALENVSFTANGSSYQLGPVQLNFSAQDLDSGNLTYFVNWFKNGTNISAYAQTGSMLSGTTVRVTPPVSVYNVSDNWYARVWVSDGTDISAYNNTHNTTIQNYFSSVVAYAPNATSYIYTQAYINFTVNGAQNASARFTLGTQNVSMTNSGTGNNYEFYNTAIVPPAVSEPTNYEGVWYYRAILANGSYYELTTNQSVNVGTNGFFICNATINTTAIEYTMLDSFTLLPVNASVSLLTEWVGDDGSIIAKSLTDTNETVYICVTPSTFNRQTTISESISATGYLPAVTFRASQNYSSDVTQRTIYLTSSSSGSVYTFQTLNQFGGPVSGATVKIMQGSTTIFIGITDETGSALAPLTELNIYQVIASATGYSNSSFNFIAGATTTIPITLVSTSASNITAPNYQEVFNEVQFTIAPTTRFFSSPTNITYTISSPNSTLWSWGFFITSNGTVVNTQTSTTTTGGSLYYTVNQTGTYILNIWFKADGFANYTPPSYFFTYGNTSGVSTASENLQTGSIISGFGFYLLAVIFAMMGALWISQYSPEGAAIVGLLILCAFTFMWSDAIVLQTGVDELGQPTGITSLMATGFVLLTTLSAFYLRQYGA